MKAKKPPVTENKEKRPSITENKEKKPSVTENKEKKPSVIMKKESPYEKALKLANEEIIARAISDMLKRQEENKPN